MTFNETQHPRATDGKFAEKTGAAAEISLGIRESERDAAQEFIEVARFDISPDYDVDSLARELRSEGLTQLPVNALATIMKQQRFWEGKPGASEVRARELAEEVTRSRSADEYAIATHMSRGSGPVWTGKDSDTPDGYFSVFGKGDGDIHYNYLLDDETKSIVGRTESSGPIGNLQTRVYAGGHLYGGYYMGGAKPNGLGETFADIVRERERMDTTKRVDAELDAASDERIAAYNRHKAEGVSTLEHVLTKENGIPIMVRNKMIRAYSSDTGRDEMKELIESNASSFSGDMLRDLRRLAENEDM